MRYTIAQIKTILHRHLANTPVKRAVLFGSYAKGCANENSDLDLVVDLDGNTRNFAFWGVYEVLREAFSIPVELFEKSEILPGQEADREIQATGVVVYGR